VVLGGTFHGTFYQDLGHSLRIAGVEEIRGQGTSLPWPPFAVLLPARALAGALADGDCSRYPTPRSEPPLPSGDSSPWMETLGPTIKGLQKVSTLGDFVHLTVLSRPPKIINKVNRGKAVTLAYLLNLFLFIGEQGHMKSSLGINNVESTTSTGYAFNRRGGGSTTVPYRGVRDQTKEAAIPSSI